MSQVEDRVRLVRCGERVRRSVCLTEHAGQSAGRPRVGVPLDERVIHEATYDLAAVRRWG